MLKSTTCIVGGVNWGVMSVAFLCPVIPPMHTGFYFYKSLLLNCFNVCVRIVNS